LSADVAATTLDPPVDLPLEDGTVRLRRAIAEDLEAVVGLLADDPLGRAREALAESADLAPYLRAFDAIDTDPNQLLLVVDQGGQVLGTMQLTFIPGLSRRGALRLLIEAVRVADSHRGQGLGAAMMRWTIEYARGRGCAVVQLTSDKSRQDAHRFYERLGFVASHKGYKLAL
jgi:GNAT superfamily N-acetyltransferase